MPDLTLTDVARRLDVAPATLRRWVKDGIVPIDDGRWTPTTVAHARIVARLRERGHSLDQLREAAHSGRLSCGCLEDRFPPPARTRTLAEAAAETGLEPALIERIWSAAGSSAESLVRIGEEDMQLLRYMAKVLGRLHVGIAFADLAVFLATPA